LEIALIKPKFSQFITKYMYIFFLRYHAAKNAAKAMKPDEKPHKRYLKTGVYFKKADGKECKLFHGFKHVHIERVMCRP
jgi:hypothetical protein